MSFLIDDLGGYFRKQRSKRCVNKGWKERRQLEGGRQLKENLIGIKNSLGSLQQSLLGLQVRGGGISLNFVLNKIYNGITFMLGVNVNRLKNQINLVFRPIIFNQTFLRLGSSQRRIYGCKIVAIFNKIKPKIFNQFKLAIDTNTGLIKIYAPVFCQVNEPYERLSEIIQSFIKIFIVSMKDIYVLLITIIEMSNQNPKFYITNLIQKYYTNPKLHRIFNYIKLLNFSINTGEQQKNDFATYQKNMLKQQLSLLSLNKNYINTKEQLKSYSLFGVDKQDIVDSPIKWEKEEIVIGQSQKFNIIKKIEPPQTTHTNEGGFVVNYIRLMKKINPAYLNKVTSGGFADIYLTEIQYILAGSYMEIKNFSAANIVSQKVIKKVMILKRQKVTDGRSCKNKVQHQRKVLINLKNAFSTFIPYYYFLHSSPQEYPNDLLMEYIHIRADILTLDEYYKKQKHTMSQHTKVFIAIQILQGLRLLKDYEIVHLDLKPSNIMVGRRLQIKLIDFGQSYHPSFGYHQPGNSMPYSAPETYLNTQVFDSKSDVFSVGTILYYLLAGKHPFYIYSQKQRSKVFKTESLADRWFFVPQGFIEYGECTLFPFIMLLVGRCLHTNAICRPELEWLNLILRQYLQFY